MELEISYLLCVSAICASAIMELITSINRFGDPTVKVIRTIIK
jgi:hypothetical protein